jgi:hypothetical protein
VAPATMIPDKRAVWHPRRDDRFVVGGGTQIALYELAREFPEIRHVTSRHDLHHMRVRPSHYFAIVLDRDVLTAGCHTSSVSHGLQIHS